MPLLSLTPVYPHSDISPHTWHSQTHLKHSCSQGSPPHLHNVNLHTTLIKHVSLWYLALPGPQRGGAHREDVATDTSPVLPELASVGQHWLQEGRQVMEKGETLGLQAEPKAPADSERP